MSSEVSRIHLPRSRYGRDAQPPVPVPANIRVCMNLRKYFGPGTLVAAAFIGPGTVTVCTLAGAEHGFTLLWALAFSVAATLVLQEMAARLGWATQAGLGAAVRRAFPRGWRRLIFVGLILAAIVVGNAAYEAGNIGGAVLGIEAVVGGFRWWPLLLGAIAFAFLASGRYRFVERLLVGLVLFMSLCFVVTAAVLRPDPSAMLRGLIPGPVDAASILTVVALVGTTVVPYNLFLHSSSVPQKWGPGSLLADVRREGAVAILLGGLISMAIVVVAATAFEGSGTTIASAADMARQLEPLLGSWARGAMGLGLFAAGISSAITAPLAAALATRELFAWPPELRDRRFRAVWMGVLGCGVAFASIGVTPVALIRFAQAANGVLLPMVAVFLLLVLNRTEILGQYRNRPVHNLAGWVVVALTVVLAARALYAVLVSTIRG